MPITYFIYQPDKEEEKLYNAQPCHYTDGRFIDTFGNFYNNTKIYWTRYRYISLKSCVRRTLNVKNIPAGTLVDFTKGYYYRGKNIDNSYSFRIKKENKLDIQYEINRPEYFNNFVNCERSKTLTDKLRENGFIVSVERNESFIGNMINTAVALTGKDDFMDAEREGDVAIAYGYGKIIGYSSTNNDFQGYSNGCENILWEPFGYFNKWSQCREIPKTTSIDEIINILKQPNPIEDEY